MDISVRRVLLLMALVAFLIETLLAGQSLNLASSPFDKTSTLKHWCGIQAVSL